MTAYERKAAMASHNHEPGGRLARLGAFLRSSAQCDKGRFVDSTNLVDFTRPILNSGRIRRES